MTTTGIGDPNLIVLIGCGKSKATVPCRADELYNGGLFVHRKRYAERRHRWFIVSAKYGLIEPETGLAPYDLTITDLKPVDRAAWCLSVAHRLLDELGDDAELRKIPIELHMGEEYADQLYDVLLATGFSPSRPVRGMGIGEQLGWYKAKNASPMP